VLYYIDGEFVPAEDAVIPALDFSVMYGDGCFDSLSVANGVALDLDWRIERFFASATNMRIDVPVSRRELADLMLDLAARNGMTGEKSGYLRPELTRTVRPGRHFASWAAQGEGPPDRAVGKGVLRIFANLFEETGYFGDVPAVRAVLSSYMRTLPAVLDPRVKALGYTTSILAHIEAYERGADWPIFRDESSRITEVAGGNVFVVKDGRLLTPTVTGGLGGLVRRRMIDVARARGFECVETDLTRYDLECADEAFVTAAIMCVHAIASFEGVTLPVPAPGPVTVALRDAYVESALADGTPVPALEPTGR
jgi:branched-chain amino acid aminotransferase